MSEFLQWSNDLTLRYLRYGLTSFWVIYLAPFVFLKLRLAQPVSGS